MSNKFLKVWLLSLIVVFCFSWQVRAEVILNIPLQGTVSPAMEKILDQGFKQALKEKAKCVILTLDTPGGLVSSMRKIVKKILNFPLPVVVYVSPRGAHAASAGVFLVASADIAVMAPQTTLGAATPIQMQGKDINTTLRKKIEQDLLSLLSTLCARRNRNIKIYESFILQSKSITAKEAVLNKVIDFIAVSQQDLIAQLNSLQLEAKGKKIILDKNIQLKYFNPSWFAKFLSYLLHPQIAYLLFLGGLLGLFFEISQPGVVLPGVIGSICLVLGLYALSILPTNIAGILLIFLGIVFFILEIKITSFGLLGIAGMVCLIFGSYFFYDTSSDLLTWNWSKFGYGLIGMGLILGSIVWLVAKAQVKEIQEPIPIGEEGEVVVWENKQGQIKVRGELWKAESTVELKPKERVKVIGHKGLTLNIIKKEE
ncbi:membrane-bound serine protease (ClpP class) [Desulfonauticus submarinus]|uniref:Membrane-bound serine protease (ClpP class) n=1 Tax=Desulfonauticus submarinus TaxID=206665 RepID=A0A1H0EUP9_9BACT|nr:nodulation protein NfeD [Desulfonauticus submarinus]SDN86075.1 membrane-bound serine protease (ClpP class) [Desulfonauticus submarinus]